ncbi:MAG TPA: DUF4097 family beta strand repeat-containing protein [Gemmatimonadaceae bacterium]
MRRHLSTVIALVALVWAVPAAHAQHSDRNWLERCREDAQDDDRPRYCEQRTMGAHATGGTITVDGGENGGARVAGWDRDSIDIVAHVQTNARSEADAEALAKSISITVSNGNIRADGPESHRGSSWSVSFDVLVPRASDVSIQAVNGPVAIQSVHGRIELSAVNGPMDIDDAGGDVHGRTTNGPLAVRLTGTSWDGKGLDARTTNGPVTISIPRSYSAHLETGTSNGPMSIGFPITVQGMVKRHLETDLGSGGPTVRAETTNGPLVIERAD